MVSIKVNEAEMNAKQNRSYAPPMKKRKLNPNDGNEKVHYWKCQICTFNNENMHALCCEMCNQVRNE